MIKCPQCNKDLEDGAKFCDECGTSVETQAAPTEVIEQVAEPVAEAPVEVSAEAEAPVADFAAPKKKFNISKKLIALGAAGVALIVVVAILLVTIFGGGKNNYALYLKDGEMYFMDISDREPFQVTDRLFDYDISDSRFAGMGSNLSYYAQLSKDGDTIFFIDKIDSSESFNLYYRPVGDPDEEPVKLASDVKDYILHESGDLVTYQNKDGDLYQHDLEDKNKIESEVSRFVASKDGSTFIYLDKDNRIYYREVDEDKVKLDSDVDSLYHVNKDLDTVYYTKSEDEDSDTATLYKKTVDGDRVKIASDVADVINIYDSGEVYYTKSDSDKISLKDYVIDDKKEADENLTMPTAPTYPSIYDYYNDNTYSYDSDAYSAAYEEYQEKYEEYQEKREEYWNEYYKAQTRDRIRESLENKELKNSVYTLYYYDGKSGKAINESYGSYKGYADDAPVLVFSSYNQTEVEKVKISEIESYYDVRDMVKSALFSSSEIYVAVEGTATLIDQMEASYFEITDDGETIYFIDDVDEEEENDDERKGDLYKMEISGNKPKKAELYDSDVYVYSNGLTEDNRFYYFKDVKDSEGELYIDKEKIDSDVYTSRFNISEDGTVVYMTDYDSDKRDGTLKIYDGDAEKIADDVYSYTVTPGGEVLYLRDYSTSRYEGDLYIYDGDSEKVDEDVAAIIPIIDFDEYWD